LFLNADLDGLLTPNGNYQFDTTQLFNYEKYFKNLQIKEVTVLRLNDARNFIQIVLNSSYYLPSRNESMKYYWEEFNGKILLSRKNDDNIIDDIDVFIEEEFRTIDSIKVMTYYYDNDSYIIELCSKKNLNNLLPIGYSIVQEWKELDSLTLEVANASDEIINKLSQENRIDLVSIKNYNALHK
jgi:hypothetical protein